ncbi:MAG: ATP-binding protein [Planctomycetota bacterium]
MPKLDSAPRTPGDWEFDVAAMASALVHEIKNPLSTIKINAQLLVEDSPEPETPREERGARRLQVISSEIQRLERIVQSFLRFTEHHELNLDPSNLNTLFEELAESIGAEAASVDVHVRLGLDQTVEPFAFDSDLIRQVFLNLAQNALHAMESQASGELMLRTHLASEDGRDYVVGEVIDTGPGMTEHALGKIFELYFSTREEGNGLGLSVSKRIVEEHGGFIRVESEEGKGSRFSVFLPLKHHG